MTAALVPALVVGAAVVAGSVAYGRWAGWSFGLRWWGRPTPARVRSVEPLRGAVMRGGAEWAVREARHRVRATLEVHPEGRMRPYDATTITWRAATEPLTGEEVTCFVARTRRRRVFLPPGAAIAARAADDDPTAGVY
ncbi:MAG: hypothetical protein KDB10_02195 [Acidimicrobiales bacterium]|nr:hypothetical protein [Acidimicrobiales bacterium]